MRSVIICFSAIFGLVLSAPVVDVTDSSISSISPASSTDTQLDDSNTIGSLADTASGGAEGSDGSIETSKTANPIAASDSTASQSPDIGSSESQVSYEKVTEPGAWDCPDFSLVDTGMCEYFIHGRFDGGHRELYSVNCVPGQQNCLACWLTEGDCVGGLITTSRKKIGHFPSHADQKRQPWCKNDDCAKPMNCYFELLRWGCV